MPKLVMVTLLGLMVLTIICSIMIVRVERSRRRNIIEMKCKRNRFDFYDLHDMLCSNARDEFISRLSVEGCIILVNRSKGNKAYVDSSSNVAYRLEGIVNGDILQAIHEDVKNGDKFDVVIAPFNEWRYEGENLVDLQKRLINVYYSLDSDGKTGYNLRMPS